MGINPDSLLIVQAQVYQQIDAIEMAARQGQSGAIASRVDALKAMALELDLPAVSAIASQMKAAVAGVSGTITMRPYLEALQDAVHCQPADAAMTSALLASINQRLAG